MTIEKDLSTQEWAFSETSSKIRDSTTTWVQIYHKAAVFPLCTKHRTTACERFRDGQSPVCKRQTSVVSVVFQCLIWILKKPSHIRAHEDGFRRQPHVLHQFFGVFFPASFEQKLRPLSQRPARFLVLPVAAVPENKQMTCGQAAEPYENLLFSDFLPIGLKNSTQFVCLVFGHLLGKTLQVRCRLTLTWSEFRCRFHFYNTPRGLKKHDVLKDASTIINQWSFAACCGHIHLGTSVYLSQSYASRMRRKFRPWRPEKATDCPDSDRIQIMVPSCFVGTNFVDMHFVTVL